MKTLKLTFVVLVLFFVNILKSQVSVNVNIGSPPMWGPVGYPESRYYYIPDVESYYDVQSSQFIYFGNGVWLHSVYLPARYRNYDLYNGYKVVITDYNGNAPYIHFKNHKVKYHKGYRGAGPQKTIGQKPGRGNNKMSELPNRQKNNGGAKNGGKGNYQKQDNGSHKSNGHGGGGHGGGKGKNK